MPDFKPSYYRNSFTGPTKEEVFFEILGVADSNIDWDTLIVDNNNFVAAPGEYAIKNQVAGTTLNAEDNWWGDASGPYHSTNIYTEGAKVSDNVDFDPWLMSEFN